MSPGIKIKDHNKQVDLTFHFTQQKKSDVEQTPSKGDMIHRKP